jgi:hypothetical protein
MNLPKYHLSPNGEYVIENYNSAPAFSSFFPGISGPFGCPMWVFYANRGQCITSLGIQDKDGAILEFQPANKAYRSVALQGFRTFIKVDGKFYEPFVENNPHLHAMYISPAALKISEENAALKIRVEVVYFTLPHEPFPALARKVLITNLSSQKRHLELLDGLPVIIPAGFSDDLLKKMAHTTEAWCLIDNLGSGTPFYRLKVVPADITETRHNERGHFFLSFANQGGQNLTVNYIVNSCCVFAENSSFGYPAGFINNKKSFCPTCQQTDGCFPSAFAHHASHLKGKEAVELFSLFGQVENKAALEQIQKKAANKTYFEQKYAENNQLIDSLCHNFEIKSASSSFDLYTKQTFLDNVLRGGWPVKIGEQLLYIYYRKHGDMERDYNDFKLDPTYFSQGTGNYRDINQNRRNDVLINPEIADDNIIRFFNLLQLDGFNPLVVLGSRFYLPSAPAAEALLKKHLKNPTKDLVAKITFPFLLGALIKDIEVLFKFSTSREAFAEDIITSSLRQETALYREGFWIDHFFYNTDLLESFECIYPDRINALLFNKRVFTFFDNDHVIADREEKYAPLNGKIRQQESVRFDPLKSALINQREEDKNLVRSNYGKGTIYKTSLIAKLLCLVANKAAAFDAEGIGLEMEADKPDWYDALNGLPALCGSSLSETLELKRLCQYVAEHLTNNAEIILAVEIKEFLLAVTSALKTTDNFKYRELSGQLKEAYRTKTKLGVSGQEEALSQKDAAEFVNSVITRCNAGIKKCLSKYNNYHTYFINEVVDYTLTDNNKVSIKKFKQIPLPLFLEGFVHALKVEKDKKIYSLVRRSALFDKKLKMYKVNAPLKDCPLEIGRARVFASGWLENESIWLHMEYKYLLELLKAGMYQKFFADLKNVLVPFMDPKVYRRSILENSSFIVSSAHANPALYGRGFYARLSGASAEFIDMWLIMMTGKSIFYLDKREKLCFKLSPVLPAWMFSKKGELKFRLLGTIPVTYINKSRKNTYNKGCKVSSYQLTLTNGENVAIEQSFIEEPYASLIRKRKVRQIVAIIG